jgi:hypothetical protein
MVTVILHWMLTSDSQRQIVLRLWTVTALHRHYRSITGCLSYLVNLMRPDLVFAYSQLNKFVQYPGVVHLYARTGSVIPDTRKSTGYLMSLNGDTISWRSSRQGGFILSSSEAQFVDASQAGQEVVYLRVLLRGFGYTHNKPTEI